MEQIGTSMLRYIARLRVLRARIIRRHAGTAHTEAGGSGFTLHRQQVTHIGT